MFKNLGKIDPSKIKVKKKENVFGEISSEELKSINLPVLEKRYISQNKNGETVSSGKENKSLTKDAEKARDNFYKLFNKG